GEEYGVLLSAFRDVQAGRAGGREAALAAAGVLAHFAGDAAVPLHATRHHHGWVGPNPEGFTRAGEIHQWFESALVARIDPAERGGSRAARWLLAPPSCGDQPPARVPRAAPRRSSLRLPLSLPGSFASLATIARTDSWGRGPALDDAVAGGEGEPGRDARSGSWASCCFTSWGAVPSSP